MRHENEEKEIESWNCYFCHKPKFNGLYRVKNQYGQTGDARWNGINFEKFDYTVGVCLAYADPCIIYWKRKEGV